MVAHTAPALSFSVCEAHHASAFLQQRPPQVSRPCSHVLRRFYCDIWNIAVSTSSRYIMFSYTPTVRPLKYQHLDPYNTCCDDINLPDSTRNTCYNLHVCLLLSITHFIQPNHISTNSHSISHGSHVQYTLCIIVCVKLPNIHATLFCNFWVWL